MDKAQLFSQFINNKDTKYSDFWVQSARLKSYVENVNHLPEKDWINISSFSCKSEVNVVVSNGPVRHCFVFGLEIRSDFEQLLGKSKVSLTDLSPKLFLDREVEEGYTALVSVDNKHPDFDSLQADIANIFKDSEIVTSYEPCTELQLRRALLSKLEKQLMTDIKNGENTELVQQISTVARQSLTESVTAISSVATALLIQPVDAAIYTENEQS